MKKVGGSFELSATDLVGYLHCRHLTVLDRAVADGALAKPKVWDPLLQILSERGATHEQSYIEHLTKAGLDVVRIDGIDVTSVAVAETLATMRRGVPVIVQGALSHQGWNGRADILRRVAVPSALGGWSYEPIDTKLARETKAGAILQLCLYADLLTEAQGLPPEYMYVVAPWSDFEPQQYRFADYAAYFRKVKRALRTAMATPERSTCCRVRSRPTAATGRANAYRCHSRLNHVAINASDNSMHPGRPQLRRRCAVRARRSMPGED